MDKRELSQENLQEIYSFCKRKDIRYLDLRLELVDHIASRIEALWEKNPQLSFKDAFHKVYKSFGVFGLSEIAEEHQKVVSKRFYQGFWSECKTWFKPPRVFVTLGSIGALYVLQETFPLTTLVLWYLIVVAVLGTVIYVFAERRKMRRTLNGDLSLTMGALYQWAWVIYLAYFIPLQNTVVLSPRGLSELMQSSKSYSMVALVYALLSFLLCLSSLKLLRYSKDQLASLKQKQAFYQSA